MCKKDEKAVYLNANFSFLLVCFLDQNLVNLIALAIVRARNKVYNAVIRFGLCNQINEGKPMLKKKAFVLSLIGVFIVLSLLSTANAETNFSANGPSAFGVGTFVHDHEGVPHKHYFAFSVSDGNLKRDGWYYKPDGKFYMIATHDKEVHMIAISDQIQRFKVVKVEGGLSVIFEGVATVKHMDADWERGWKYTVEAFDSGLKGTDSIHIMFTAPDGTQHHMEGTLTSGNIQIKK